MSETKEIPGIEHYLAQSDGQIISKKTGLPIRQILRKDGYLQSHLYFGHDGSKKIYKLKLTHRLIGLAFIPQTAPEINHKNGIKADNRVENLEWVTRRDNILHSINSLGNDMICRKAEHSMAAKLTPEDADRLRRWYVDRVLEPRELSKFFGVSYETVFRYIKSGRLGRTRKHQGHQGKQREPQQAL